MHGTKNNCIHIVFLSLLGFCGLVFLGGCEEEVGFCLGGFCLCLFLLSSSLQAQIALSVMCLFSFSVAQGIYI